MRVLSGSETLQANARLTKYINTAEAGAFDAFLKEGEFDLKEAELYRVRAQTWRALNKPELAAEDENRYKRLLAGTRVCIVLTHLKCFHGAVGEYLKRANAAALTWPLPGELDDASLDKLLYPARPPSKSEGRPQPNCIQMREELKKNGVTLLQLWAEYRDENPLG